MISNLLFFTYELLIYFICLFLVYYFITSKETLAPNAEQFFRVCVYGLLLTFIFIPVQSFALTILNANRPEYYFISAIIIFMIILIEPDHRNALQQMLSMIKRMIISRNDTISTAAVLTFPLVLFFPVIVSGIHPIVEVDSLHYLNFVIDWSRNVGNPLSNFAPGYTAFWELNYLPLIVISNSLNLTWAVSLKAISAIFLLALILSREIGLRTFTSIVISFSVIALKQMWLEPSGMPTLKNDMIYALGFLTLIYGGRLIINAINSHEKVIGYCVFFIGVIFILSKYSGLLLAGASCFLLIILDFRFIRNNFKLIAPYFSVALVVMLATTGCYYIRNIIVFLNPFYPAKVVLGPSLVLNGYWNLEGTSLFDRIGDPLLYRHLESVLWLEGPIFPIIFFLGWFAPIVYIVIGLFGSAKRKQFILSRQGLFVAILIFIAWMAYFKSYWSAGMTINDYQQIVAPYFNSIRYATGVIILSEIMLYSMIKQVDKSEGIIIVLAALQFGGRYQVLIPSVTYVAYHSLEIFLIGACSVLFLLILFYYLKSRLLFVTWVTILVMVVLYKNASIFQANSIYTMPNWHDLTNFFYNKSATSIGIIQRNTYWDVYSPVVGKNLQHRTEIINITDKNLGDFDYLVRLQEFGNPNLEENVNLAREAYSAGFIPIGVTDYYSLSISGDLLGERCEAFLQMEYPTYTDYETAKSSGILTSDSKTMANCQSLSAFIDN